MSLCRPEADRVADAKLHFSRDFASKNHCRDKLIIMKIEFDVAVHQMRARIKVIFEARF